MQTLTSIRRCGWSGRIVSLPLLSGGVFFPFLFSLPRPQVALYVRSGPMRAQNASFRHKKVPFGGLQDVPLNFGGKISQKLNDQKFKSL